MKAWRKKLAGTFAAAVLTIACAAGSIVRAVQIETPDIDRSGSISIVMEDPETQNLVPGGTLTLYRVAAAKVKNGADYYFELTESFAESGERLVTLDAKLAERFSAYVKVKELKGDKQTADASGYRIVPAGAGGCGAGLLSGKSVPCDASAPAGRGVYL